MFVLVSKDGDAEPLPGNNLLGRISKRCNFTNSYTLAYEKLLTNHSNFSITIDDGMC